MDIKIKIKAEKITKPSHIPDFPQEIIDAMEGILESYCSPPYCPKCGRKRFIQYMRGRMGATWYHCTLCDVYVKKNIDWGE